MNCPEYDEYGINHLLPIVHDTKVGAAVGVVCCFADRIKEETISLLNAAKLHELADYLEEQDRR